MKKFVVCVVLAVGGATLHASIMYSAVVPPPAVCGEDPSQPPNCVSVSMSWANEPPPGVSFAVVTANGNPDQVLFALNVPPVPTTTGSIVPNPQTIYGLDPTTMQIITNGQISAVGSFGVALNDFAELDLENPSGQVIDKTVFIAQVESTAVPEPAAWPLISVGLVLVLLSAWRRRRKVE